MTLKSGRDPSSPGAVCSKGCAFCCTHFGNVDAITLEALIIHEWIETLDKQDQIDIRKKIAKNMKKEKSGQLPDVRFLKRIIPAGFIPYAPLVAGSCILCANAPIPDLWFIGRPWSCQNRPLTSFSNWMKPDIRGTSAISFI